MNGRDRFQVDTIFALASGAGRAAIAIVRMSGPAVSAGLRGLAGTLPQPRRATVRVLRDPVGGEPLDRAVVLWFPAPASYTGEDCAELHLHGGVAVVAAVADALVGMRLRPAEPGEFTRRAFAQGKLDLLEAEGIADLIDAETEAQRRQAFRQAEGGLSDLVVGWGQRLLGLLARQEASIEFEDQDLPGSLEAEVEDAASVLAAELRTQLVAVDRAERLRAGVRIAIVGAVNAGKSTLFNALAGREAAIVSPTPGTTRDVVEARIVLAGVSVTVADTAGLRASVDPVEREGMVRAHAAAAAADIVMAVLAADVAPCAWDAFEPDDRRLNVVSKIDLLGSPRAFGGAAPAWGVSARTGEGMPALWAELEARVAKRAGIADHAVMTRPRHRAAVAEAAAWLERLPSERLPEVRAEVLRAALGAFGRLTGQVGIEQVLDEVFGAFCIGK